MNQNAFCMLEVVFDHIENPIDVVVFFVQDDLVELEERTYLLVVVSPFEREVFNVVSGP